MRKVIFLILALLILALVALPALVVYFSEGTQVRVETTGPVVRVLNHRTQQVELLPLEEYLLGVVAAEMPAAFEKEALKAQAVAARTYTVKKMELAKYTPNRQHPQAQVCTDSTHCQAWISEKEMLESWGVFRYSLNRRKIEEAVAETAGIVLVYEGKLIDPVYHSTGVGRTENSGDVWQFDLPYLKSVASPGDRESPKFQSRVTLSLAQLDQALGTNLKAVPAAKINSGAQGTLQVLEKTKTGRVKTIRAGTKTYTGEQFRRLLGLNSSHFTWQVQGDKITFQVTGYGHGVGMSQYGANYMAKQGKNYKEILRHYYTGVELRKYVAERAAKK